jgi:putative ABC transport system permease protein
MIASRTMRDVWDGFRGSPGRIVLALAALTIGMIALTLLLAVLGGLQKRAEKMVQELGANVVALLPGRDESAALRPEIASLLAANLRGVEVSGANRSNVSSPDGRASWLVIAADEALGRVRDCVLRGGRFLDGFDVSRAQRNAVVTESLARRAGLAIGSELRLQETLFTVVGIVGGSGVTENDQAWTMGEDTIFIPRTIAMRDQDASWRRRNFDAIYLRLDPSRPFDGQLRAAERVIASAGRDPKKFSWVTPESLLAGIRRMQQAVAISAGGIAGLCLVLGGMTLMSLMMANVRERIAEIGLRRAIGARPLDIAALFVFEACLTTFIASAIGVGLAAWVAVWLAPRFDLPLTIDSRVLTIPVLASILLGCIFSALPAFRAARLQPAEALRND